jgi:hypothetical protein
MVIFTQEKGKVKPTLIRTAWGLNVARNGGNGGHKMKDFGCPIRVPAAGNQFFNHSLDSMDYFEKGRLGMGRSGWPQTQNGK